MSDFMISDEMIDLDFTGVKAASFGPVPDGDYVARILPEKLEVGTTKNGNKSLTFWVELIHAFDENFDLPEGKRVRHQFVLSEKSLPFAKPFFDAITDASGIVSFSPSMLVGKEVGVTLGHSSYTKKNEDGSDGDVVKHNTIEGWFKTNI